MPGRIDWPVNLGAERIANAFCEIVTDEHETPGSPSSSLLAQFVGAVTDQYFGSMLDHWLKFRCLDGEVYTKAQAQSAVELVDEIRSSDSKNAQFDRTLRLFKLLLGITLVRPILSPRERKFSTMYYAAIHHHLLDDGTRTSIMDSVIIRPRKGTAGDALRGYWDDRKYAVHSPVSFGERRGVVEWQDLVMGQVSMLVAAYESSTLGPQCTRFIVSAFFPLPGIFDTNRYPSGFRQILDKSVDSVGLDVICSLCDARLMLQMLHESEHTEKVLKEASAVDDAKGQAKHFEALVESIAQRLVPPSFVELPTPLLAAAFAMPDSERPGEFTLAALALDERAVKTALHGTLAKATLQELDQKITTPGVPPELLVEGRIPRQQIHSFEGEHSGVWILHASNGAGWPDECASHFQPINRALRHLQTKVQLLTPDNRRFETARAFLDSVETLKDWRHRHSVYKLRQNVLASFLALLSRVLCCPNSEAERLANQLEYILKIALSFRPKPKVTTEDLATHVKLAVLEIRRQVRARLKEKFLGTSSMVFAPGGISLELDETATISFDPEQFKMLADVFRIASLSGQTTVGPGVATAKICLDTIDCEVFKELGWLTLDLRARPAQAYHSALLRRTRENGGYEEIPIQISFRNEPFWHESLALPDEADKRDPPLNVLWERAVKQAAPSTFGTLSEVISYLEVALRTSFSQHDTKFGAPILLVAYSPDEPDASSYAKPRFDRALQIIRDSWDAYRAARKEAQFAFMQRQIEQSERLRHDILTLTSGMLKHVHEDANKLLTVTAPPYGLWDNLVLAKLFESGSRIAVWTGDHLVVKRQHDPNENLDDARAVNDQLALVHYGIHQLLLGPSP